MKKCILTIGLVLFLCSGLSVRLFGGGGFDNSGVGLKGFSMGSAFYGIADDASAVYYNPGGLVFPEKGNWNAEVYGYLVSAEFKYTANTIQDTSKASPVLPGFFISRTFSRWALGFGYYIPYGGGGVQYENFQGLPFNLEFKLGLQAFTPSVAYKIAPNFSVGLSVSLYQGKLESDILGVESNYSGIAGYGATLGFMYKPSPKFSLGFSARSPVSVKLDGSTSIAGIEFDSDTEFKFPYYFALGFGYRPNPDLLLGFSLCYMLWNNMEKITFSTLGIGSENLLHYKNSVIVGLGADYKVSSKLAFRGGLKYTQGAAEDEGLIPASNDVDLFTVSLGVAAAITDSIEFDIAGHYVVGFEREYNYQTFDQDHFIVLMGIRFHKP